DLCLEPLAPSETNFLNTCTQARALIDKVNHPHFKLHMDVKAQSGEIGTTVPELIRQHARSAGHFHAQDVNLRGPGMGNVDFGPIMKALVDSGYDRWSRSRSSTSLLDPRKPRGGVLNVCGGSCQPPRTGPEGRYWAGSLWGLPPRGRVRRWRYRHPLPSELGIIGVSSFFGEKRTDTNNPSTPIIRPL